MGADFVNTTRFGMIWPSITFLSISSGRGCGCNINMNILKMHLKFKVNKKKPMTKYQYAQLVAFQYCERFNPDWIWI